MRKKKKKSTKTSSDSEVEKDNQETKEMSKMDIMLKIDDLKSLQQTSLVEENTEKAMQCANEIIELAIRYNMSYRIKEQEDFLQSIAKREQKKYFITEIEEECLELNEKYEHLLEANEITQAHELVESFKEKYNTNPDFETHPLVKALLEKERRIWITYLSTSQDE